METRSGEMGGNGGNLKEIRGETDQGWKQEEIRGKIKLEELGGTGRNLEELGGNGGKKIKLEELGETGGTGRNWEELGGTWRKSGVETS